MGASPQFHAGRSRTRPSDGLEPLDATQQALLDAAGTCLARWGVTKTTVADLATEAGCSRATVYRAFPGGKNQIMAIYAGRELQWFFDEASRRIDAASDLGDALVAVITVAARGLAHHEGFQFMLAHEPGMVLPYLGFAEVDRLYRLSADALAGNFERFAGDRSPQLVEITARITLSHMFQPSPDVDLCNADDARRIVDTYLVPIVENGAVQVPVGPDGTAASPDHLPTHLAVPA